VPKPITIHILSDSIGETADAVARAVAAQFPRGTFRMERLPKVESTAQLCELVGMHCGESCIFFFTLAEGPLREEMERCIQDQGVKAVDILGPGVELLSLVSGITPKAVVGAYRLPDEAYYDRIEAMEFAIKHDDGQQPEGLLEADVVLIGVSRTSKTPLSMYLASKGFRAANVPLVPLSEPPIELFEVDPRRVFGLITSVETLTEIRSKRMDELGSYVPGYAERERVEIELEEARALMRRIGCLIVRTDNRAIEETAQDIIRYLKGRLQTED
jgi:regulator of PEP synthase PpsR (kinase-PPPase family)